jgi:hypothetical protein
MQLYTVGSGLRSVVEKQLGSHSRWSRWPDQVLLHAARVHRTARSRSLAAEKGEDAMENRIQWWSDTGNG